MAPQFEAPTATKTQWKLATEGFTQPSAWRASWQLLSTLALLAGTWGLIAWGLTVSIWLALAFALLNGGLLVRLFIIFHDCGHGSFYRSRWANDLTGFITGLVTFTPYSYWRWQHAQHHATSGNLERRGTGDVWTLTVKEYLEGSRWQRLAYRFARNPFALFLIGPVYLFVANLRWPSKKAGPRDRRSVWTMDVAIVLQVLAMGSWLGFANYAIVQSVALVFAGGMGIFLFYVQHQYEDTYWAHEGEWDYTEAALRGSSFYDLPAVLRWFSGNIGYHHIHHLSPRVANYRLQACHESSPIFKGIKRMGLRDSLRSTRMHLWDEDQRRLIGFGDLRRRLQAS
jgi:omega-6 fatty acid desaturase (delta-12 desaturase)